jgi:hypothetical protein
MYREGEETYSSEMLDVTGKEVAWISKQRPMVVVCCPEEFAAF